LRAFSNELASWTERFALDWRGYGAVQRDVVLQSPHVHLAIAETGIELGHVHVGMSANVRVGSTRS
jgi:hypothetical protein